MTIRDTVSEELPGAEQMGQVGPREPPAEQARTVGLDWSRIVQEALVADVQPPAFLGVRRHPELAVSSDTRRQHRIEEVDAPIDSLEEVGRRSEPHEVTRSRVAVEERDGDVERRPALDGRLVAGQAADADPVERPPGDVARRLGAQVRLETALDDPEQRLV